MNDNKGMELLIIQQYAENELLKYIRALQTVQETLKDQDLPLETRMDEAIRSMARLTGFNYTLATALVKLKVAKNEQR
jgi:hypothetical protein